MEGVAAAAAGATVNLVLPRVIKKLASYLGCDVTPDEMEHLRDDVNDQIDELIRKVKDDDSVHSRRSLKKLRAVSSKLDDLFDIYKYGQLEKQVSASSSNPLKKIMPKFIFPNPKDRLKKLLKYLKDVEKIEQRINTQQFTTSPQTDIITPTTSTLSSPYFGRVDLCDSVIDFLLHDSKVPVIVIIGKEGSGKTHTAQHIYNDHEIKNYFDVRMWIHVTRDFDVVGLTRQMLESTINDGHNHITSLDVLQITLKESLSKRKRFLLVLDDFWCEEHEKWDLLVGPLIEGKGNGSKVIVTTRNEKIARALGAKKVEVGKLDDRDCWSIIKYYAFRNSQEITEDEGLSYVKNEIISKVKESPVVLRRVGCSLSTRGSVNEWMKQLKQDTLKVTKEFLLQCYDRLPLHLTQCFSYCSLFPKGYKFYIDFHKQEPHLISLWIAHGCIENTCGLTLEETGKNYVEELISQSFFEKKSKDYFVVPDLLHDLTEMVTANQCHRVEGYGSLNIPPTCIHLSFCTTENFDITYMSDMKDRISKLTNLRSLIILSGPVLKNIFQKGETVLPKLTSLRALYACPDPQMGVLSIHHIDKLKTLRYLHVQYVKKLPETLAKLYLLKIFILITNQVNSIQNDCKYLKADTLPEGFDNLVELRTLLFYAINGIELDYLYYNSKRINVGKLKSLQNLMAFHPEKDGYRGMVALSELSLCGSLSVLNLENVQSKVEAEKALLNKKKNLNELIFEWSSTSTDNSNIHEEVLEGLEPHDNLKKLEIKGYQGVKFPTWMKNCFESLQTLTLQPCTSHEIVSSLPHDLRSLDVYGCSEMVQLSFACETGRTLVLYDFPKSALPSLFSRSLGLRKLTIRGCPDVESLERLGSLHTLCIEGCPDVESLPNLPLSLRSLRIFECQNLKEKYEEGGPLHNSISYIPDIHIC